MWNILYFAVLFFKFEADRNLNITVLINDTKIHSGYLAYCHISSQKYLSLDEIICVGIPPVSHIVRPFFRWLKRKREEKRAEQQAAREQSRRLVLEERRARRMRDLMCTVNETKPFWFTEHTAYRFWTEQAQPNLLIYKTHRAYQNVTEIHFMIYSLYIIS